MSGADLQHGQMPSRDLVYDGLEVVQPSHQTPAEEGKQVANDDGKEAMMREREYYSSKMTPDEYSSEWKSDKSVVAPSGAGVEPGDRTAFYQTSPKRPWWRRKRWMILGALALIIIIIAIAVPIAVTRSAGSDAANTTKSSTPSNAPKTAEPAGKATTAASSLLPAATGTYDGIIQRTRFAQTSNNVDNVDHVTFYQAGDGSIRYIPLSSPSEVWQGPNSKRIAIHDAMPGTPLAVANSAVDANNSNWYLFYVDQNQTLKAVYRDSMKGNRDWKPQKVPNIKISKDPATGFTLGWGRVANTTSLLLEGGLSLYVTNSDGALQEYLYNQATDSWSTGFTFSGKDGSGGAVYGYMSRPTGDDKFGDGFMVTKGTESSMNFYTRDYTTTDDTWNLRLQSPGGLPALDNSAICTGMNFVTYQAPDGNIMVGNFTGSQPSDFQWNKAYVAANQDQKPLNGTGLGCWYSVGGSSLFSVLYQTQDGGIKETKIKWGDNIEDASAWQHEDVLRPPS